jgi:hypothetical protein
MNNIKSYIIEFIWSGQDIPHFEQWVYEQDSIEFQNLISESNYVELISFDYKKKTVDQVKKFIKSILPNRLIEEIEIEFKKRKSNIIRGLCIKNEALNYNGKNSRDWDVEIGKEYEFLIINTGIQEGNHFGLSNYVDRTNYFQPSGFVPMELFDTDLSRIPPAYHKVLNAKNETTIELKAFSDLNYKATKYSFWEDFYNDDEKAVNTYFETLERLGIKNLW